VPENFKITVHRNDASVLMAIDGHLVVGAVEALSQAQEKYLTPRLEQCLLHLGRLEFLDSTGLGALVGLRGRCAEKKIRFLILDPSIKAIEIFKVARLDAIFEIVRGAEAEAMTAQMEKGESEVFEHEDSADGAGFQETITGAGGQPTVTQGETWVEGRRPGQDAEETAKTHCKEAIEKVRQGEYQAAVDLYKQALTAKPDYFPALNNLAVVYEKRPTWIARAIETWERVRDLAGQFDDQKHLERAERRLTVLRALADMQDEMDA